MGPILGQNLVNVWVTFLFPAAHPIPGHRYVQLSSHFLLLNVIISCFRQIGYSPIALHEGQYSLQEVTLKSKHTVEYVT